MKKYKYFAISKNASEEYYTKKEALKDLKTFGDDEVRLYILNGLSRFEVTSEDLVGIYLKGKKVK